MQLPGGVFWVAPTRETRHELADQARVYLQRERKHVEREGYISSTSAIPGSSSPILHSSSEFEAGLDDLDKDENEARRSKPEEVIVHLVTCFLQYVLDLCLLQQSADLVAEVEVRTRLERRTTNARVAGDILITVEDDGGICWTRRLGPGWEMRRPYLSLAQAKTAFRYIHFRRINRELHPYSLK